MSGGGLVKKKSVLIILWLGTVLCSPSLFAAPSQTFRQCTKELTYDLFLSGHRIGHLTRTLKWQGNRVNVHSYSKVNILVTKSKFKQTSTIYWSEKQGAFLTQSFSRHISGLMSGSTTATFSADGLKSSVRKNGKTRSFSSRDIPIRDGDAVGSQIRLNLINGKKAFDFKLQDSDDVDHYYFEVKREEKIDTRLGRLTAFRVEQVRKSDRKLVMWFAPDIDYQLVKATYKRKLLDLKATIIRSNIQCPETITLQTADNNSKAP